MKYSLFFIFIFNICSLKSTIMEHMRAYTSESSHLFFSVHIIFLISQVCHHSKFPPPVSCSLYLFVSILLEYLKKENSPQKPKVRHISKLQAILESCGKLLGMVFGLCLVLMGTKRTYQLFSCNLHRCKNGVNIHVLVLCTHVYICVCVHKTKFACETHKPYTIVDTKYILHRILGTNVGQKETNNNNLLS